MAADVISIAVTVTLLLLDITKNHDSWHGLNCSLGHVGCLDRRPLFKTLDNLNQRLNIINTANNNNNNNTDSSILIKLFINNT